MIPDASFAAAWFYAVIGFATGLATVHLFGQWLLWRGTIEFRDDAERRIADLAPLDDTWNPGGSWPRRTK